ncbi:MAG TPA: hypothetical protein VK699_00865 [Terriglobales bacterium]|jgi:hypothetical protein|nr:hypothetical protein [Terriglobales bacterium]
MCYRIILIALITSVTAWCAPPGGCGPASQVQTELQKAAAIPVKDPTDFDHNVAPFLALHARYPKDLFVHERYQDAVNQYGIEGHLRALTNEYQDLSSKNPDDLMYRYLYARSLMGRGTASAIQSLGEVVAANPNFAPAHRSLAEIYASDNFHNARKEKVEREKFLALCPTSALTKRPSPLPDLSPLLERAERLYGMNSVNLQELIDMALRAIHDDEWRLQRIRPFDWYSADYKRQSMRELQARYWRVWSLQVRCYRKMGQYQKVDDLLASMEQRANALPKTPNSSYFDVMGRLATLYAEAKQQEKAIQKLDEMQQLLAQYPDPGRAATLDHLRKQVLSGILGSEAAMKSPH